MRTSHTATWLLAILVAAFAAAASASQIYVDPDGGGDYTTINAALAASVDGDTIVVACGTYTEPRIDIRKDICIRSETGDPDCVTLDGEGTHQIMASHYMTPGSYIEGFTFVNGYQASAHDNGGGLGCWISSATVRNCVFRDNVCSELSGGGLAVCADMVVEDCEFYGNQAPFGGGAVHSEYGGGLVIRNCLFVDNHADDGGAISMFSTNVLIEGCTFVDNSAEYGGAILVAFASDCLLSSCSFSHNLSSSISGSAEVWGGNTLSMDKCIVAFDAEGTGVSCRYDGAATLTCCDLFGNSGGDWVGCVSEELGQQGNFWSDPLFCPEGVAPLLALHADSPCTPENSPCGELVGSIGVGCGISPVHDSSWSRLKARYR